MAPKDDWRMRLIKDWNSIVGDLHTKMRLEKVKNDTLIIAVYDSHWMQELYMLSRVILRTVNKKLGNDYVAQLRFVLADAAPKKKKKTVIRPKKSPMVKRTMNSSQKSALKTIKDGKLQDALQKLFARCAT